MLYCVSRKRAIRPRIATRLLAIQCALWISISSIIPQLHQAFASHQHIYCALHHRFEDAGPKLDEAGLMQRLHRAGNHSPTLRGLASGIDSHRACQFSSIALHVSLNLPMVSGASDSTNGVTTLAALHVMDVPPREILRIAPKQSPPEDAILAA